MPEIGSNEIECARCGGIFHIEETRCPHCGVSIYEPEDEHPTQDSALNNVKNALRQPFAIFAGWFMAAFIGLLLYIPIRLAGANEPGQLLLTLLVTGTLSLGAFAGGFLYQRIQQGKSKFGNLSQISLSILIGILVFITEGGSALLWTVFSILALGVIAAASFLGIKFADKMMRKAMINDLFAPVLESQKRYLELLVKVGHDRDIAERLIEHERKFTPKATRNILVENAIKHWERDNRVQ